MNRQPDYHRTGFLEHPRYSHYRQLRQAVGRPSIDPQAAPGQQSRVRHVRLAGADDQAIDDIAAAQNRTPSAIIRDAVAEYVKAHKSA